MTTPADPADPTRAVSATETVPSPVAPPPGTAPSADARRLASLILEVLAGLRSITDAALVLQISTARFIQLEQRAMLALIAACEPRASGPVPGAALPRELAALQQERDRLRAEVGRYQALLRIAQGAFGVDALRTAAVSTPAALPGAAARRVAARSRGSGSDVAGRKPRKPRQPTVRALRLAQRVREAPSAATTAAPVNTPASLPAAPPPPTLPPAAGG